MTLALGISMLPFLPVAPAQAAAPNNVASLASNTWTVPKGVEVVQLIGTGARGGGTANGKKGGQGCRTFGSAVVSAGDTVAAVIGQPGSDGLASGGTGGFAFAGGAGGAGAFPGGPGGRGYAANAVSSEDSLSGAGGGGGATGITVNGVYQLIAAGGGGASPQMESRRQYQCYYSRGLYQNIGYGQGGLPSSMGTYMLGGVWASTRPPTAAQYPGPAWAPQDYGVTPDGGFSNGATLGGYWEQGGNSYAPCGVAIGTRSTGRGGNGSLNTGATPGVGGAGADSGWYFDNSAAGGPCTKGDVILTRSPGGGGGGGWKGGGGGASGSSGSIAGSGGIGTNLTPSTASLPPQNYQGTITPDWTLDSNFVDAYDAVASSYFAPDAVVKWATIDTDLPTDAETAGKVINQTLIATFGDGPYSTASWGWTATGLPAGWTLGATTGVLAGTVPATPADIYVTATYKIGTKRVAQTTRKYHVGAAVPTTTVTVNSQTITYGDTLGSLIPAAPAGSTWTEEPTCGIFKSGTDEAITADPIPAGTYDIKCSGGALSSADAVVYTTGTLIVNQAPTELTYTGTSGNLPQGKTATLSADVSPSACTGTPVFQVKDSNGTIVDPADSANWSVGTYTVTATYPSNSNCSGATATATIEIVDASSAVTVTPEPESSTIEFGEDTPTFGFTSDPGDVDWDTEPTCGIFEAGTKNPVTDDPIPAGNYDVVCSGGMTTDGKEPIPTTGSLTVEKAATAIDYTGTGSGEGESITSGDPITLDADLLAPDACTGEVTYTITTPDDETDSATSPVTTRRWAAGEYTVTVNYAGNDNCDAVSTEATITVVDRVVTVTPNPKSLTITYGDATPAFAPDTTGFLEWGTVESPDTDTWDTPPTCAVSGSSPLPVPVEPYAIVCSGGDPGTGYTVKYVDGALSVVKLKPSLAYTGTSGVITAGSSVTVNATKSPTACTGEVVYTLTLPDGSTTSLTSPPNTSGWSGIYTITATYPGSGNCDAASDSATVIVGTPGDSTTGGGWYKLGNSYPNPRVNFGHTVQKVVQTDKKAVTTTTTYRGQVLWINSQTWRIKGSVYSRTVTNTTTGAYVSGDTNPAFLKLSCPMELWPSGSTPSCGMIIGTGTLERYNADTGGWQLATDIGVNGTVTFSATIYDGGQVKVCKNKTCTLTDLADYFGMAIKTDVGTGSVPSTTPIVLNNSKNGQIVIRSN